METQNVLENEIQYYVTPSGQKIELLSEEDLKKRKKPKTKFQIFPIIFLIAHWIWVIYMLFVVYFAFSTAFKSLVQFSEEPFGLPNPIKYPLVDSKGRLGKYGIFTNFATAIEYLGQTIYHRETGEAVPFLTLCWNSIQYCMITPIPAIFTGLIFSYVVAKFQFLRGVAFLWTFMIAKRFLPDLYNSGTTIMLLKKWGLWNSMPGFWFWCCGPLGFFWMFYPAWKGISWEYAEAAMMDGASQWRIFLHIMLPQNLGIPLIKYVSKVIDMWDDYTAPLMYLPSYPSVAFAAWQFQFGGTGRAQLSVMPIQLAGLLLVAFPMIGFILGNMKRVRGVQYNVVGIKG